LVGEAFVHAAVLRLKPKKQLEYWFERLEFKDGGTRKSKSFQEWHRKFSL
jgi:hypothetical protein